MGASRPTSSASSSRASSLRTAGPFRTITSKRNPRSTWCFASEEVLCENAGANVPAGTRCGNESQKRERSEALCTAYICGDDKALLRYHIIACVGALSGNTRVEKQPFRETLWFVVGVRSRY